MKTKLLAVIAVLAICRAASAIPVSLFSDTETYLERSDHIVIAKCVSIPEQPLAFVDGLYPAQVEVLMPLKGDRKPGPLKIATIYGMKPGQRYLLSSGLGGQAFDTNFLVTGQLHSVPIPDNYDLKLLDGKTTKQQVQMIFARHLYEIERKLAPLLEQKAMLDKAVAGRDDDLYESKHPVKIGEIKQLSTTNQNSIVSLDLDGVPLQWSAQRPGVSGYFYYTDHLAETPDWEFSHWGEDELNSFDGKHLKARFDGRYSPSRDPNQIWPRGNATTVQVGEILFARTVADPETIYVIKLHKQAEDEEALTVKYFVWKE